MDITIDYLEKIAQSIIEKNQVVQQSNKPDPELLGKAEKLRHVYKKANVDYCIESFIIAEVDFYTPGRRGIGRMSNAFPRFGAVFRQQLLNMSTEDIDLLKTLMQNIILRGYLSAVLFSTEEVLQPTAESPESLYQKWIPAIYGVQPRSFFDNNWDAALAVFCEPAIDQIKRFMKKHRMRFGLFMPGVKEEAVFSKYKYAGYILRLAETDPL